MKITAPSGTEYEWTKPPRHVHWRHGRIAQTFQNKIEEIVSKSAPEENTNDLGARLLESLTEEEGARLEAYVSDVVAAGLGRAAGDVDDVPEEDWWFLYGQATYANKKQKVETEEGETTVEAVETFSEEPALSEDSADVPGVRGESGEEVGAARPRAA